MKKNVSQQMPPRKDAPATLLETADANAYLRWKRKPNETTDKAWMAAWCILVDTEGMTTPTRCSNCGMHRSGLSREDACRLCGKDSNQ